MASLQGALFAFLALVAAMSPLPAAPAAANPPSALGAAAAPPSAVGTEEEFEATLKLVEKTMGPGRWKKAKEMLLAALEANKDERFVLYHALEIERALKLCTFSIAHEPPEPEACVSGELVSYSASSGQIDLRYRDDPAGRKTGAKLTGKARTGGPAKFDEFKGYDFSDFGHTKTLSYHALTFEGPFTIEIKGKKYPRLSEKEGPPRAWVCLDWDRSYYISFGNAALGGVYNPALIAEIVDGEPTVLVQAEPGGPAEAPYELKIVVTSSQITVYRDGTKLVTAKKAPSAWGQFAYANCPTLSEISIKGKVQPAFMQGAIDRAVQKQWALFEETYDPASVLPAWFVEKTKERPAEPDIDEVFPGKPHPKNKEHLTRVATMLEKDELTIDEVENEVARLTSAKADEISEDLRLWLCARLNALLGKPKDSLAACEKVRELDPVFVPASLLRAALLEELGRRSDAMYECEALIVAQPTQADAYTALASLLLRQDKPDVARQTLRGAIDAGIPAAELAGINGTLLRCMKGPSWTKTYDYKSEHYHVSSDISQEMCFKAATQLEKFYRKYNVRFERIGKAAGPKRMFRVFLFSGQEGYLAYTNELVGERIENTNGLYSSLVKQLLIWNLPDNEDMLRTIRHEGFHQYLDQIVDDAPRWLNEGMAEYFEGSKLVKGNWSDGELNLDRLGDLRGAKLTPLKEFLWMSPSKFLDRRTVSKNYAQAWAFVHFLLQGGGDNKKRFEKLFDALVAGAKPDEAVDKAFGDADFAKLDRAFADYVAGLK